MNWLADQQVPRFKIPMPDGSARWVDWGHPWQLDSAAYWIATTHERTGAAGSEALSYRLGESLEHEVVACLLGGYGISFEMNMAAFDALRASGCLDVDEVDATRIDEVLRAPLQISGRLRRYRFPTQKASRIAAAVRRLRDEDAPIRPDRAREWLLTFSGIGPKTASWIIRNQFANCDVAIIDIHVQRAGVVAGVFDPSWTPARDYWTMETAFLAWADQGCVRAADLDAVIWRERAARARGAQVASIAH